MAPSRQSLIRALLSGLTLAALAGVPQAARAGHTTGHNHWIANCAGCHGNTAVDPQYNAAGVDFGTLDYVISAVAGMNGLSALSDSVRNLIAQYIATELPSTNAVTAMNSAGVTVNVSAAITAGGVAFTHVRTTTNPANGTLTYPSATNWAGHTNLYTPNTGFVGYDSFTYRGYRLGTTTADSRTVTITVGTAPVITSSNSKSGTVGVPLSYTIVATNNPSSYSHLGTLPAGLSRVGSTNNVISGTPTAATNPTQAITMRATNALGTAAEALTFTIAKGTQTVTFPAQTVPTRTYAPSATFAISPLATSSAGASITYSSLTASKCTVSGTTVTIVSVGDGICTLQALGASTANYNSDTATRNVTIIKASQTISFGAQAAQPYVQGGSFPITTGTATSGLLVTYGTTTPAICSVAGTTVSILTAGGCIITANQAGNGNYDPAPQVMQTATINGTVPGAPTINSATPGDATANVSFSAPLNNGGSTPLSYTASCSAVGQTTRTATGGTLSLLVTTLTNGVTYACSVRATNATGQGPASGSLNAMPSATPVAPTVTSLNNTTFTVLSFNTFTVTATGIPAPSFSVSGGTLPGNVNLNSVTGVLSGTPDSGTVAAHNVMIRATNGSGFNDQAFTLNVIKANQSINFTDPADQGFSLATVPLTAAATSNLAVSFATATPGVCSVTGSNVTLIAVGDCTINATQGGNLNYNAATLTPQTFAISKGNQSITFGAQTTASRAFSASTFSVAPLGTASSNLAVAYGSDSPDICTVAGTTVTMLGIGTCKLSANQPGNGNWNAATPVTQDVQINVGSQSITFAPTQPAQLLVPGGTFALSPVASASSGLAISYTTLTPSICTVSNTTVTMVTVGTCTIAANQEGNANYSAATQMTRGITISPNVPGAPVIGTAVSAATGQLNVSFSPPANDGGSAITSYTATCTAAGQTTRTATGPASPLLVSSMVNGVVYSCSVTAANSAGTGAPSSGASGTPGAAGPGIWASVCSTCHGDTPAGNRFNAAGTTRTILDFAITTQADMQVPTVQALTTAERDDLVAYITSYLTPVQQTVAVSTPRTISVASHLTLNTPTGTFNQVEIMSQPSHGTLGAFTGTNALYTPTVGYIGTDTFTYRGRHTGSGRVGDTHTATITVDPNARVLSVTLSSAGGSGVVLVTDPGGSQYCVSNCTQVFNNGTQATLFAEPDPGSAFTGWTGACTGTGDCLITLDANKAVTATFGVSEFFLTVIKSGSGTGTVTSGPAGIDCGATCSAIYAGSTPVTLTATPAGGSVFSGWSGGGCSGTGTCQVTMDQAHTVTATFGAAGFTLTVGKVGTGAGTVTSTPAGIDCGSVCATSFSNGTVVNLGATPAGGSTFTGWGGACAGTGSCQVTLDAARSVTATFTSTGGATHTLTVSRTGTGAGNVSSSPAGIDCGGTCSAQFADGAQVQLFAAATAGSTFAGWTGDCTGTGVCNVTLSAARNATATFTLVASGSLTPGIGSLDFGGQSMGTTSPPLAATLTNTGAVPVTVSAISLTSAEFAREHNCTTVAAGASCTVSITFTPAVQPGALNAAFGVGGTLNVTHSGSGSPISITVLGTAEKSLVTHYYRSILRRAPDAGGVPYWQGEAARVAGLGANVNETWFALAQGFYTSAEYLAFNRDDTGFVTDLYATFFNRAPDGAGLGYWTGLLTQGMPREVVLVSFMFSTEFANFTQSIFGNTAARAEVDTVVDFYRGLLSRLPDSGGFDYWVGQFRTAQCSGGPAVYAQVEGISNAYVNSPEYGNRGRNNAQFVGDMYNAFMRRGGDLGGVQYWVSQLDSGARTRENVRQAFISTPEFNQRVVAVINQGCL